MSRLKSRPVPVAPCDVVVLKYVVEGTAKRTCAWWCFPVTTYTTWLCTTKEKSYSLISIPSYVRWPCWFICHAWTWCALSTPVVAMIQIATISNLHSRFRVTVSKMFLKEAWQDNLFFRNISTGLGQGVEKWAGSWRTWPEDVLGCSAADCL